MGKWPRKCPCIVSIVIYTYTRRSMGGKAPHLARVFAPRPPTPPGPRAAGPPGSRPSAPPQNARWGAKPPISKGRIEAKTAPWGTKWFSEKRPFHLRCSSGGHLCIRAPPPPRAPAARATPKLQKHHGLLNPMSVFAVKNQVFLSNWLHEGLKIAKHHVFLSQRPTFAVKTQCFCQTGFMRA